MNSAHPVFVHASTDLDLDEAGEFITRLRTDTRTQAQEIKSSMVLAPKHRAPLLAALAPMAARGNLHLVDKSYYTAAKLIDLLVVEDAFENGVDLAGSGSAANLARVLHQQGPASIGDVPWRALLTSYNELIRSYLRAGSEAPSATEFLQILDVARTTSADQEVTEILEMIWRARRFVAEHEGSEPSVLREMDPMASTMHAVSMTWSMRLDDAPFEFLADEYYGLNDEVINLIVQAARLPLSIGGMAMPRADLLGIRLVDSKSDSRVQVADILGGVGREIARLAYLGEFDDPLQVAVHEMLDFNGMWSLGSPLDVLCDRRPLRYFEEWVAVRRGDH